MKRKFSCIKFEGSSQNWQTDDEMNNDLLIEKKDKKPEERSMTIW